MDRWACFHKDRTDEKHLSLGWAWEKHIPLKLKSERDKGRWIERRREEEREEEGTERNGEMGEMSSKKCHEESSPLSSPAALGAAT